MGPSLSCLCVSCLLGFLCCLLLVLVVSIVRLRKHVQCHRQKHYGIFNLTTRHSTPIQPRNYISTRLEQLGMEELVQGLLGYSGCIVEEGGNRV
jgi:hypothetical protein